MSEPGASGEKEHRFLLDGTLACRSIGLIPTGILRAERDIAPRLMLLFLAIRMYDQETTIS